LALVDAEYFIKLHKDQDGTRNKNRDTSTSE
jgi:hypothetical protein